MDRRLLLCLFVFCWAAPPASPQQTRTFPEAECSFTLPGEGWSWLDPQLLPAQGVRTVVFTKNRKGVVFTLGFDRLKPNEKPRANSYESFEVGFLESGAKKKLGARHLSFKGVPSYQLDVEMSGGRGGSVRILYANDRFYMLQILNALGPSLPEAEAEPIFQGFNFTVGPRPMLPSGQQVVSSQGRSCGWAVALLVGIVVVGMGAVGAVLLVVLFILYHKRKPTNFGP